jgi:hypothetical protein
MNKINNIKQLAYEKTVAEIGPVALWSASASDYEVWKLVNQNNIEVLKNEQRTIDIRRDSIKNIGASLAN